ncbi:MAG: beta-galactosidase [Phycisphaerae bacterium]|nr:beta-galactosidase [Phycisphaerae bacterium]
MKSVPYRSFSTRILLAGFFLGAAAPSVWARTASGADGQLSGSIAIFKADLPQADPTAANDLRAAVIDAGFSVTFLTAEEAGDSGVLCIDRFMMLIIPNARYYPADAVAALTSYIEAGGRLMTIGGPAFENLTRRFDGRWFDDNLLRQELQRVKPDRILLPFDRSSELDGWHRATNDTTAHGTLRIVEDAEASGGRCLGVHSGNLTNWDTWYSPPIDDFFVSGHSLLCLRARGDAGTGQMAVEVRESDDSRWFAVIDLQAQWKHYVLSPEDFSYWPDSKTQGTRGHAGDRLNPEKARVICLGLASSHTTAVGAGAHSFWVDQLGTAANPFAELAGAKTKPPVIETISPSYKVYEASPSRFGTVGGLFSLKVRDDQEVLGRQAERVIRGGIISPHPRFMGRGLSGKAKWRWMPLADAMDMVSGRRRGSVISMQVCNESPYKGTVLASAGLDAQDMNGAALSYSVVEIARRMQDGVFLLEAGSEHFSYWAHETPVFGAEVINTSKTEATTKVRITVKSPSASVVFREERELTVAAGESKTIRLPWHASKMKDARYTVRTELLRQGKVVDSIWHEMGLLSEHKAAREDFVSVRDGDFYFNGSKWYPVGVNYWPMYAAGLEAGDYWLHWLAPGAYDPQAVDQDLWMMRKMGVNMVSIQTGRPEHLRNLLDFLRRCGGHGIRVNAYIDNASPLGFREDRVRDYIRAGRLDQNPVIFAWDTIWEPGNFVFSESWRPRWDGDWRRWIVERYGSVENAEKDWAFAAPRTEGRISSPSDQQLREEGPWRIMVAAYRRFMDDLMSRKWNDATRSLRAIVPNHLISFRQGNTLPHDFTFTATAKHIDFICPEGYAIPNSEDGYHAAAFITRYVRFTTGGKPIIWSEFGKSVWNAHTARPDPLAIADQGSYHDIFYRVVLAAGAQGTAPWWWPGGYRFDEKSDFGIMNPDGTPRPAAVMLAQYAARIKAAREYPVGGIPFIADRDAHPGGYWYMAFNTGKDACAAAASRGGNINVRTAGTGTTSADTPLAAVGNVAYNGTNPAKYLNAEFNYFRVRDVAGRWVDVRNGDTVRVAADRAVLAAASVGNLQEAKWLTPENAAGRDGAVYLASTEHSQLAFRRPIGRDTPYLHDAEFDEFTLGTVTEETAVEARMAASGRAAFGEKIAFTLRPE